MKRLEGTIAMLCTFYRVVLFSICYFAFGHQGYDYD